MFFLSFKDVHRSDDGKTLNPGLTSLTKMDGNYMVGIYGGNCYTHDGAGLVVRLGEVLSF